MEFIELKVQYKTRNQKRGALQEKFKTVAVSISTASHCSIPINKLAAVGYSGIILTRSDKLAEEEICSPLCSKLDEVIIQ